MAANLCSFHLRGIDGIGRVGVTILEADVLFASATLESRGGICS